MQFRQFFLRYKIHHLIFWVLLGAVWYFLRYQDYSTTHKALMVTLIKTIDLAIMVYIANYLLIPYLLYKKRYILFVSSFILMIAASSIYKMYIIGKVINNPALFSISSDLKSRIYDNVIPHFFLVIAGVAFKLLLDYTRVQKRLVVVAKEKAEAELNFLKSQMNPHFLFNSLNSVYFLIDKKNIEARQALHKFSDMLRYQLYEVKGEKIPIEQEINYLQDYIDLQKLRMSDNCQVQLNVASNVKNILIEPLLLVPFVENSFKHLSNFSNGRTNEIKIDLSRQNGEMNFYISNTTEGKQIHKIQEEGGIGLVNVKRRLELLYTHKYELKITEQDGWFDVQLKIKIDN